MMTMIYDDVSDEDDMSVQECGHDLSQPYLLQVHDVQGDFVHFYIPVFGGGGSGGVDRDVHRCLGKWCKASVSEMGA